MRRPCAVHQLVNLCYKCQIQFFKRPNAEHRFKSVLRPKVIIVKFVTRVLKISVVSLATTSRIAVCFPSFSIPTAKKIPVMLNVKNLGMIFNVFFLGNSIRLYSESSRSVVGFLNLENSPHFVNFTYNTTPVKHTKVYLIFFFNSIFHIEEVTFFSTG